jgi:N-acetyl-gamma-glutamyl-phosphate reductase
LPELNREQIKTANKIANPGCFATCIQLGLLPLAKNSLLKGDIHISATTGSTGAGQSFGTTSHFSWRQNNLSVYKAFEHQHLNEIGQSIKQLQNDFDGELNFIPARGSFTRGIFGSIYTEFDLNIEEVKGIYKSYYSTHPFVHISENAIDLKQVVNTNKCLIHLEKHRSKLLITSCIDNLLKGASGQAIQNMNLLFGLEETAGLKLKATFF